MAVNTNLWLVKYHQRLTPDAKNLFQYICRSKDGLYMFLNDLYINPNYTLEGVYQIQRIRPWKNPFNITLAALNADVDTSIYLVKYERRSMWDDSTWNTREESYTFSPEEKTDLIAFLNSYRNRPDKFRNLEMYSATKLRRTSF